MRTSKIIKIVAAVAAISGISYGGYTYYEARLSPEARAELSDSVAAYKVEEPNTLWTKEKTLKPDDKLYVVDREGYISVSKDVIIKRHGEDIPSLYVNVSSAEFADFKAKYLNKFMEDNKEFDYRFIDSLKGIGKRIGVEKDPVFLIRDIQTDKIIATSIGVSFEILKLVLFVGLFASVILLTQGAALRNNISRYEPKDLDDSLDDLVGLDDVKSELLQLEEMIKNRKHYASYGITNTFNVMLTGPAGVGKTKIARCLSKRLNIPMFYASGASIETGYIGGGPKTLKKLVERASKLERSIIFLDEAEGLLLTRNRPVNARYENETMTTLLSLLDGVGSKSKGIIWVVASNFDEHKAPMDEAMLRRFHLKINFRLPNASERKEILKRLLSKRSDEVISDDIELDHVATICSGMSPAILESLVARAGLIAIQEQSKITQDIMLKAFERIAVGLTDRATTEKMESTRRQIAIHEAGHFITQLNHAMKRVEGDVSRLAANLDVLKISTESVSKHGALGFVLTKSDELPLSSRREYEEKIVELYGGMANEELFMGEAGVTAGAHNDIERVTNLLGMMFNEVGYYSPYKLNLRVMQSTGLDVGQQRFAEIQQRSEQLYGHTLTVLETYRDLTTLMADTLMENYVMTQGDYLPLLQRFYDENPAILAKYTGQATKMLPGKTVA